MKTSFLAAVMACVVGSCVAFMPSSGLARLPSQAARPSMSRRAVSMVLPGVEAPVMPSSVMVADYKSTVEEIVQTIGSEPWLQVFIPTAIGMFVGLTICFILYISAQPAFDIDDISVPSSDAPKQPGKE